MAKQLPAIIPVLMDCLQDTHPKVAAAGSSALKAVAQIIEQPEIQKNMANLTEALTKPDQKTNACLEKLMETTFCNPMDCSALAVVVPVVARGLRERSAELKKIAAMTAGNIFALVQNPRDMKPFVPVILPEVAKACEHSHPDVRKAAERAKEKLLSGAQMEGGAGAAAAGGAADDKEGPVAARVREHLRGRVPEAVAEFAAEEASLLLEEGLVTGEGELEEIIGPVVAGYLDAAAAAALCEEAVRAFRESRGAGSDEHAGKDLLVHIPNIILAFAGRVLMNKTSFYLERGHCYGAPPAPAPLPHTLSRLAHRAALHSREKLSLPTNPLAIHQASWARTASARPRSSPASPPATSTAGPSTSPSTSSSTRSSPRRAPPCSTSCSRRSPRAARRTPSARRSSTSASTTPA